jgi:hypothetical protein
MQDLFERRGSHLLERLACRPREQQSADEAGAEVINPLEHRWALGCHQGHQPIAEPGVVIDQAASILHERWERSGLGMIWPPGLEPVPMVDEPCEPIVRSPRSILGSAGREGFTVLGQRGRVNRVEAPKVVLQERVDAWATRRLQTDGNRSSAKSDAQRGGPGIQRFRSVLEEKGRLLTRSDVNQTDIRLGG